MKRIIFTLCLFTALISSANAGEIYNCTDRDGNAFFTDNPQDGMKCVSKGDDAESTYANETPKNINLMPKYGLVQKNKAQLAADKELFTAIDKQYKGDRKKAAEDAAMRGWQFLRKGDMETAMKRFNQAWLLDSKNGKALWGMAAIQGNTGKMDESLQLFSEAEQFEGNDIDFAVDQARAIGLAAMATKNEVLITEAFHRYEQLYKRVPRNILNLQNWAIALYYTGNYTKAWEKIKMAETAPRGNELDKRFIAELQSKMPRP
jgi:tetratricopeptide (TPR) repeat protein